MKDVSSWLVMLLCLALVGGCATHDRPDLMRAEKILAFDRLGEEYYVNKEYEAAKDVFTELKKISPHHENAISRLGNIAFQQRDLDAAEAYFNELVTKYPENMRGHYNLGVIYLIRAEQSFKSLKAVATPEFDPRAVESMLRTIQEFASGRLGADTTVERREMLKKLVDMVENKE